MTNLTTDPSPTSFPGVLRAIFRVPSKRATSIARQYMAARYTVVDAARLDAFAGAVQAGLDAAGWRGEDPGKFWTPRRLAVHAAAHRWCEAGGHHEEIVPAEGALQAYECAAQGVVRYRVACHDGTWREVDPAFQDIAAALCRSQQVPVTAAQLPRDHQRWSIQYQLWTECDDDGRPTHRWIQGWILVGDSRTTTVTIRHEVFDFLGMREDAVEADLVCQLAHAAEHEGRCTYDFVRGLDAERLPDVRS